MSALSAGQVAADCAIAILTFQRWLKAICNLNCGQLRVYPNQVEGLRAPIMATLGACIGFPSRFSAGHATRRCGPGALPTQAPKSVLEQRFPVRLSPLPDLAIGRQHADINAGGPCLLQARAPPAQHASNVLGTASTPNFPEHQRPFA